MFSRILFSTLLISCQHTIPKKIVVPKPLINDIVFDFKKVESENIDGKICLSKENVENLLYNIAMSRIYFNQSQMNLKLTQDYYSNVVVGLGAIEK